MTTQTSLYWIVRNQCRIDSKNGNVFWNQFGNLTVSHKDVSMHAYMLVGFTIGSAFLKISVNWL